ncbi:alpha/beta hydrolase [Acinetobacter pragensis]|uniref:Alpha/beta hydrolase n=2 Tax=Acinetobacter pragensis TaxID=1806892 RepID=A0A151Y6W2_9GAMM|nr:alpha/beta hydrolase [Acinetobacter pragensis]
MKVGICVVKMKFAFAAFTSVLLAACQTIASKPADTAASSVQQSAAPALNRVEAYAGKDRIDFHKLKQQEKRPIVALVLGSGGARGYAHIGAIQVLEAHGIKPDFIVGTSAGSIVGTLYASGLKADELREVALSMKPNDVREIRLDKKGVLDGKKVEDYVNKQVNNTPLELLKTPMYVVATELQQGKKMVFNSGNTGQAVRASVSIPSMFIPAVINHQEYVDGGLVSPVPVDVARDLGADIIIAVDILAQPVHTETSNVWGLFNQNINIMQYYLAKEELKRADVVIQPDIREKAHIFDVNGREATIQAGVTAAEQKLNAITNIFAAHSHPLEREAAIYSVQQ